MFKHGDKITVRRKWGTTKEVEFAGLVMHKDRKAVRVAYRAQVFWPPCGGLYDIELEQGRLMRTATKPMDPGWFVDEQTLDKLVAMAEREVASKQEARRAKWR